MKRSHSRILKYLGLGYRLWRPKGSRIVQILDSHGCVESRAHLSLIEEMVGGGLLSVRAQPVADNMRDSECSYVARK